MGDETHYSIGGVVLPGYHRVHDFGVGASAALAGFVLSADAGLKLTETGRHPHRRQAAGKR